MTKKKGVEISPEWVEKLVDLAAGKAADETVARVYMESIVGRVNYYRIVEKVLYNYKKMERLANNDEITVELHGKSKSVTVFMPNGGMRQYKMDEDIAEELAHQELLDHMVTSARFHKIKKIIDEYRTCKEFIVIRMYYFGEDADGNERTEDAPQYTWEEIAFTLSERGILKDIKTARRWRNKLINDIAIGMFGIDAAISSGVYAEKRQ